MADRKTREVTFAVKPKFKEAYRELKSDYPAIKESLKTFNDNKRKIPPERLPKKMKDHVLQGKLAGIRECHLDDDVLLLYLHQDDVVTLLHICRHEDLHGKRGKQIAAYISQLMQ
jgi:mRNA interferase YafQ